MKKMTMILVLSSLSWAAFASTEPVKPAVTQTTDQPQTASVPVAPAEIPAPSLSNLSPDPSTVQTATAPVADAVAPASEQPAAPVAADAPVAAADAPTPSDSRPAEAPLEAQLQGLEMPANMAPAAITQERFYSVQNRFSPLKYRSEIGLGGGYNFKGNGYMTQNEADLDYRFHFSDRWSVNAGIGFTFNSLNDSGKELVKQHGLLPDAAYPKYRAHLLLGFNTFYGKLRFSMDSVTYFDQYIAIGPGVVSMNTGKAIAGVGDVGFVFWLQKWGSLRVGVRNEIFTEKRTLTSSTVHHMVGHMDFAFLLGGSKQ